MAFKSLLKVLYILKSGSLVLVVAAILSSVEVDGEGVRTSTEDEVVLGVFVDGEGSYSCTIGFRVGVQNEVGTW